VEANHPLVDMLEEMAYLHSVLKDDNWGYRARAFKTAASAVESLDEEVKDARSLGDRGNEHHVDRVGKSSAEAMQAFLDSGKKHSPQLDELRRAVKEKENKSDS
jgi:DNA polymerase/3'-5' exonuclease PolX